MSGSGSRDRLLARRGVLQACLQILHKYHTTEREIDDRSLRTMNRNEVEISTERNWELRGSQDLAESHRQERSITCDIKSGEGQRGRPTADYILLESVTVTCDKRDAD